MKTVARRTPIRLGISKSLTAVAAIAAASLLGAMPAKAQEYPTQTVKVVVAFSAGGTTDILARLISNHLSQEYKQSFVVENKPGAGGNIGKAQVVSAPADGHTLIVNSVGPIAINPTLFKLKYDPLTALVPIVQIADVPNVLVVNPELGIKNMDDLIAQIKAKPGEFNYSSTGVGTSSHLSGYMMGKEGGLDITHVPYKGADALNDLLAGRVQFMFATIPSVHALISAGKLKAIAVSSLHRSRSLPDVPTMDESGFKGFQAGSWFGFFAPEGTPDAVVQKLNASVNRIIKLPDIEKQMVHEGADPIGGTPEQYKAFIKSEYDRWKTIVIESGAVNN